MCTASINQQPKLLGIYSTPAQVDEIALWSKRQYNHSRLQAWDRRPATEHEPRDQEGVVSINVALYNGVRTLSERNRNHSDQVSQTWVVDVYNYSTQVRFTVDKDRKEVTLIPWIKKQAEKGNDFGHIWM